MITLQHVIRAFAMMLTLLMMQGCSSMELAIDLYKKQKRDAAGDLLWQRRAIRLATHIKWGIWYYPERDLTYDETGIGSWYGDEFAGKLQPMVKSLILNWLRRHIKPCQCPALCG